jgi:hypothetical protein
MNLAPCTLQLDRQRTIPLAAGGKNRVDDGRRRSRYAGLANIGGAVLLADKLDIDFPRRLAKKGVRALF